MPGAAGERALLAPARHPAVDEPRVAGVAALGPDAEALGDTGAVALDQDVGAGGEVEDAGGTVGCLEVDDHRSFVAVRHVVLGVDGESGAPGPVHADHVGAQVGEEHGGERTGPDARQLDHPHARERTAARLPCHRHRAPHSSDTTDMTPAMLGTPRCSAQGFAGHILSKRLAKTPSFRPWTGRRIDDGPGARPHAPSR